MAQEKQTNISVTGYPGLQSPDSKSQLLPSCSRLIEILPWPDHSTKQNRIYGLSKANQRKRTKVYQQPELFRSKEVSDVWVNNVLLLQRALNADCLGNSLPWWKVLTLWLLKGQDLDSGVFIGKKTSNSTKIISLLLLAFYQQLCGCTQELCVNAVYLRKKGWVEWSLQMQMLGFSKALEIKDHEAGLRLLACFPLYPPLPQERGWHHWEPGSVCFSEENKALQQFLTVQCGIFFLGQDIPFHIHCIRDLSSQNPKYFRALSSQKEKRICGS